MKSCCTDISVSRHPHMNVAKKLCFFFLFTIFWFGSARLTAVEMNLRDLEFYIHKSVDEKDIPHLKKETITSQKESWVKVIPREKGDGALSFRGIADLVSLPNQSGLFERKKIHELVFVTFFELGRRDLENLQSNSLLLDYIGVNWRVWLNGKIIRSEMYGHDGFDFEMERRLRKVEIPIDSRLWRLGENALVFEIQGYARDHRSGFRHIADSAIKEKKNIFFNFKELQDLVFVSLYLGIAIFFLAIFSRRKTEVYNFYFCLLMFLIALRVFSSTQAAAMLLTDTLLALKIEYITNFLITPLFILFIESAIFQKTKKFTYFFIAIGLIQSLAMLLPFPNLYKLTLQIWQITAMLAILYIFVFSFFPGFKEELKSYRSLNNGRGIIRPLREYLTKTVSGNLCIAFLIFSILAIIELLLAFVFLSSTFLMPYALLSLFIGMAYVIAVKHMRIFSQVDVLSSNLTSKSSELSSAYQRLDRSENTFKMIVESAKSIFITMTPDLIITGANSLLKKNLGYNPQYLKGKNIQDILFHDENEHRISNELFLENLKLHLADKKEISCKVYFRSSNHSEPIEMDVKLQYVALDSGDEVILQAEPFSENKLIRFFVSERQNYLLGNFLVQAEELSHRLVMNLPKYVGKNDISHIRVCLREMLINAIEHGNLGITFDEKTEQQMEGDYFKFVYLRQQLPEYRDRKVRVQYALRPKMVAYKITDEGDGFDHQKVMEKTKKVNQEELAHGRGIMMASNYFDKIVYNKKGNSVMMIKYFKD